MRWGRSVIGVSHLLVRDYRASKRALLEATAILLFVVLFLVPDRQDGLSGQRFFTFIRPWILGMSVYSTLIVAWQSAQPQAYPLLLSPIRRSGFFIGLHLAVLEVLSRAYLSMTVLVLGMHALVGRAPTLPITDYLRASVMLSVQSAVVTSGTLASVTVVRTLSTSTRTVRRAGLAVILLLILWAVWRMGVLSDGGASPAGTPVQVFSSRGMHFPPPSGMLYVGDLLAHIGITLLLLTGGLVCFQRHPIHYRPG